MFVYVAIITVIIVGIAFMGIGIKMFLKKGGQFERHCANDGDKACVCGGSTEKSCANCPNKANKTTDL